MSTYNAPMTFTVTRDPEGGILLVRFTSAKIHHTGEVRDDEGHLVALVDVAADGSVVDVEIINLDHFDLDACAARYGFADRATAIGAALAVAA